MCSVSLDLLACNLQLRAPTLRIENGVDGIGMLAVADSPPLVDIAAIADHNRDHLCSHDASALVPHFLPEVRTDGRPYVGDGFVHELPVRRLNFVLIGV